MAERLRLGLLFGGRSGEHEVSLISARSVLNTLDPEKYQITQIGITLAGDWLVGDDVLDALSNNNLDQLSPAVMLPVPARSDLYFLTQKDGEEIIRVFAELDVIFPVLHGSYGEDGTMQGLFDSVKI